MNDLQKKLWLAEVMWRSWKVAKAELEQELGCTIEALGFQPSGRLCPTAIDSMFAASAGEIRERAELASHFGYPQPVVPVLEGVDLEQAW